MKREYKLVIGVALAGGVVTFGIVFLLVGKAAERAYISALPTPTLIAPAVSIVLAPTKTPEPPTATPAPILRARLSHYWPPLGPPSCAEPNWSNGECTATLTDGKQWQHWSYWSGVGTACPKEFERGTVFRINEGSHVGDYICIDRGGAINMLYDSTFYLDLLSPEQPFVSGGDIIRDKHSPHGSFVVTVTIVE